MLGQAGLEQVDRLEEVPVGRDHEVVVGRRIGGVLLRRLHNDFRHGDDLLATDGRTSTALVGREHGRTGGNDVRDEAKRASRRLC